MNTDSDLLFVYGTLRPSFTNEYARYLRQYGQYVGEGTFPGQLLNLGTYPGAIYQVESRAIVYGSIYNIGVSEQQLLAYLDTYEGIGEAFTQPHEYIRSVVEVNYGGHVVSCWTYLYNLPTTGKQIIAPGDYAAFIRQ